MLNCLILVTLICESQLVNIKIYVFDCFCGWKFCITQPSFAKRGRHTMQNSPPPAHAWPSRMAKRSWISRPLPAVRLPSLKEVHHLKHAILSFYLSYDSDYLILCDNFGKDIFQNGVGCSCCERCLGIMQHPQTNLFSHTKEALNKTVRGSAKTIGTRTMTQRERFEKNFKALSHGAMKIKANLALPPGTVGFCIMLSSY